MTSKEDLLLIVSVLQLLELLIDDQIGELESLVVSHVKEQRRLTRALPLDKVRTTWESFCARISTSHFRRMFRMTREMFSGLCARIETAVGSEAFRSEAFLQEQCEGKHLVGKRPPISGEVKVAVSIRMLAGGSYLDLVPMFDISGGHTCVVFRLFLSWVLKTLHFPSVDCTREQRWNVLESPADEFAEKTNGVFCGPFASLDGLAVRIRSPTSVEVSDPGSYFCGKGFYALNVQAICDMHKRFLWAGTSNKGSTHDSTAFTGSRPYDLLLEFALELYRRGLFIAGDSACGLAPFLVVPHEQAEAKEAGDPSGAVDSFNFHPSSCRIYIECAFGELVMRWGILWRTLLFDLKRSQEVVKVCMLLQNHTIDNRDTISVSSDNRHFRNFDIQMDDAQQEMTDQTGEAPRAAVTDNNEHKPAGRRTNDEERLRQIGSDIRRRLTVELASHGLRRPLNHSVNYNSHGHVYFDD